MQQSRTNAGNKPATQKSVQYEPHLLYNNEKYPQIVTGNLKML